MGNKRSHSTTVTASGTTAATATPSTPSSPPPTTASTIPWVIIGLGNGKQYIHTRHNIGQDSVSALATHLCQASLLKPKQIVKHAPPPPTTPDTADTRHTTYITPPYTVIRAHRCYYVVQHIGDQLCYIAITDTYMNNSGTGVKKLLQHIATAHNISLHQLHRQLIIVYDELDLQLGTLRLSSKQVRTSHNGISDVQSALKDYKQFVRLRVGIGDTRHNDDMSTYVLDAFTDVQRPVMDRTIQRVRECIEYVMTNNVNNAMSKFNKTFEQLEQDDNVDHAAIAAQRQAKRLKYEQHQAEQKRLAQLKLAEQAEFEKQRAEHQLLVDKALQRKAAAD